MSIANATLPRLLIVDDNPAIHSDIRKTLVTTTKNDALDEIEAAMFGCAESSASEKQFEIEDAYQGKEALRMVTQACDEGMEFDVAIVDMRMPPGWDGVETIERLWKVDPDLQVIICTAFSDYSWDEVSERLGVHDKLLILKKPFDDCEMSQAIRALSVKRKLLIQSRYNLETLQELVNQRTRELEAAHGQSARLLSAISSALVAFDAAGIVTHWNTVAERLFGIPAHQAVGQSLPQLPICWEDADLFGRFFEDSRSVENSRIESVLCRADHSTSIVELSLHPLLIDGLLTGGLMLAEDVSERRLLEQQLQQAQKLESVGQLAAGIAHEINTPLQYVGDNVQFVQASLQKLEPVLHLLDRLTTDGAESNVTIENIRASLGKVNLKRLIEHLPGAVRDAHQGVQSVTRIVYAMKEFSHPGSDNPTLVNINQALESTVVVSRSEWKYVAELETDFGTNMPSVPGYAHELQQVFLNLIVNAAHAVETRRQADEHFQGKIRVTTICMDNRCLISIQDNGCGIPRSIRNRVYDPFFTTKGVGKGTGQGLAIAHQIVAHRHQGKLWFDSEPNVGTTFFIELPLEASVALLP